MLGRLRRRPSGSDGSAKITRKGTFKAELELVGPGGTKPIGTDAVVDRFLSHGRAKGTVTSHFQRRQWREGELDGDGLGTSEPVEHEADRHRAFADGRRAPLDRPGVHVTDGEHTGWLVSRNSGVAVGVVGEVLAIDVAAGEQEACSSIATWPRSQSVCGRRR